MFTIKLICALLLSRQSAGEPEIAFKGLGSHTRKVTTKSARAQQFFDQGMAFLFGFNHDEAIRSFDAALRYDPNCAMAYWGRAMACGPHVNNPEVSPEREKLGTLSMKSADMLKSKCTPQEKALIAAGMKRFNAFVSEDSQTKGVTLDRPTLDYRYMRAMEGVYKQFPNDADVCVLYAESMMDLQPWDYWEGGKPKGNTVKIYTAVERALRLNPKHPQACHL